MIRLTGNQSEIRAESDGVLIADISAVPSAAPTVTQLGENVWKILWTTEHDVSQMKISMKTHFAAEHTMIPAVLYDGNPFGHDHEYKGYEMDGESVTMAWHRCAIPSATLSWSEEWSAGMYGEQGTSCSLVPGADGCIHSVVWPEEETPKVLYSRTWGPAFHGEMEPAHEFSVTVCFGGPGNEALKNMLHEAWKEGMASPRKNVRRAAEVRELSLRYAKLLFSREENGFCGFNIGLAVDDGADEWTKRKGNPYEIGWCGQNASMAISLIQASIEEHDPELRQMGLDVLDSWCSIARSPEGYLLTRYGDPREKLIDATNLGVAGAAWLEAWTLCRTLGIEKPQYRKAYEDIVAFVRERMLDNGCTGMSWNTDGTLNVRKGTAGAFLALPFLAGYATFGDPDLLSDGCRIYEYYLAEFRKNGFCTSGALDTCCIDKEGAIPLMKSAVCLAEKTGDARYVQDAEEIAAYLSTWQWHTSTVFPNGSVLEQIGYDTFGGTAVSTSHHHLDDFALCYIPELIRLSELSGHSEWYERAMAIWYNGIQGISDGTMKILDKPARPAGSADEGYLHTRWGWGRRTNRDGTEGFSVSQWLVAWPCAFRLEVLRRCPGIQPGFE